MYHAAFIAYAMLTNRSIICFGGEDWWYHHPHSKAHLMRKFARAGQQGHLRQFDFDGPAQPRAQRSVAAHQAQVR